MRLLSPIIGKVFNTPVINLLAWNGVEIVRVFVLADMHFNRFMEPTDLTEGSVIGAPIPSVAGATDSEAISGSAISWHRALAARPLSDSAHRAYGSVHGGRWIDRLGEHQGWQAERAEGPKITHTRSPQATNNL
jgi:hypothetical protein